MGLWVDSGTDQVAACEKLVDELVSKLKKNGRVVDVGCGEGATTGRLLKYWNGSDVVAIDISKPQLEIARSRVPGCDFRHMSATKMDFEGNLFEDIICVEAAMHFNTRQDFLKEAFRLLKPGGRIALSDLLMPKWVWYVSRRVPAANWLKDATAYEALMTSTGFTNVEIRDVTDRCFAPFFSSLLKFAEQVYKEGKLSFWQKLGAKTLWGIQQRAFKGYLLVSAQKPKK